MNILNRYKQVVATMDELLLLISKTNDVEEESESTLQEARRIRYSHLQRRKKTLTFLYYLTFNKARK